MPEHLLRALLGIPFSVQKLRGEMDCFGQGLEREAHRGVVTVRLTDVLSRASQPIPERLKRAADEERLRIRATIIRMAELAELCRREGVTFVFTKAFQHLPDMGHDIDLLLDRRTGHFDIVLVREWGARRDKGSLSNFIAGKTGYMVPDLPSPLEIHHGRMGQLGEHEDFAAMVLRRAVEFRCEDFSFSQPSLEDQLLIQTLQRLYCHFSFRLSDILHTRRLLECRDLDWSYVESTARRIGVLPGLRLHLAYLKSVLEPLGIRVPLPAFLASRPCAAQALRVKGLRYVFPRWAVAGRLFGLKLLSDVRRQDLGSAGRLGLFPLVAVAAMGRNLFFRRERF